MVEALFNTSHLSDVGCTYKLLHRDLAVRLLPDFQVGDSHFGPELMLRVITSGARFVEVPVNYLPRVGHSAVTGDLRKAFVLGMQMIAFILRYRLATLGKRAARRRWAARAMPGRPPGWLAASAPGDDRHRRSLEPTNFDAIAGIYDAVFPPHVVEHYLRAARRLHALLYCPGG